jgi:DNA-binding response OmpR family regulator
MTPRVLIAESDDDVRELLELTVSRLGYEAVGPDESTDVHAMLVEPASAVGRSVLRRFGANSPPVICLSIYPREQALEHAASVAYLVKPASSTQIAAALRVALAV